jgi:DNA-binding CsgD family transcriptional regulator
LRPAGIEYFVASHVFHDGKLTSMSVMRGPDDPVFTDREVSEMSRLVPHLQRAVAIQRRLAELDFGARMSLEALDKLPVGLLVVDATLGIRAANAPARRLLDAQDGLLSRERRLIVEDRRVHAELLAAVGAVIAGARDGREIPARSLSVRRARAEGALSIRLGTLWGNHLKFGLPPLAEPLAVLFVADPSEPLRPSPEAIRAFFGLTEAEAELAAALAAGRTLKGAAADLGRATETCRSQLKSAFQKTGTSRQADLIRLVLTSPSWIDP